MKHLLLSTTLIAFAWVIEPSALYAQCLGGAPNGILDAGDECDDNNLDEGDGCDNECRIETGWLCSQPVDFANLDTLEYAGGNSNWIISADGFTGTQTVNTSTPTVAVFGADATAATYTFDMGVTSTTDDDFIGFVFGFELSDLTSPDAEYILLDWKRRTQGCGAIGMALSRVTGQPTVSPVTTSNFWCHSGNATNGVNEFARASTYGSTGWAIGTNYRFEVEYSLTRIVVRVQPLNASGVPVGTQVTAFDVASEFPSGQVGFYGLSQNNVRYTVVGPRGPSLCNQPPVVPDITTTVPHQPEGRTFNVIGGATDPDGDGIDPAVQIVSVSGSATVTDPSGGAAPGNVSIVPDDLNETTTIAVVVRVCDDRPAPQACTEMTLTVTFETPCEGRPEGDSCRSLAGAAGTCRADGGTPLSCCTGCWTGSACAGGDGLASCGAAGAVCANCVDGNDCTTDACAAGACTNAARPVGTSCGGGVCSGPSAMCVECVSGDQCSDPTPLCALDTNACVGCIGDADCGGATPLCDPTTRACVACLGASDCDDSNECTANECNAGVCSHPPVANGTACTAGICTPEAMCVPVEVAITTPLEGSTVATATPTITGTGTPGATVVVSIDGEVVGMATVAPDGTWSLPISSPLSEGAHMVSASMTTSNGSAMDMSSFIVDTETEVSIVSPADESTIYDSTPNIWGTGEPGATVVVTVDGEEVGTATVGADGRWVVFVTTPLEDGTHTAEARATDAAGNTAEAESTFTVESGLEVTISSPPNGSTVDTRLPTIEGMAPPGSTVEVVLETEDGPVVLGTVTADAAGNWSLELGAPLDEGQQTVTATARESDGNVGSDSTTFIVDASTFVTIETVDPDTGVITGTGEPGSAVVVTVDGEEVGTTTVGDDGTWQVDAGPLSPGRREIEATATDPMGNSATARRVVDVDSPMTDAGPPGDDAGVPVDGGPSLGGLSGGAPCATTVAGSGSGGLPLAFLALVGLALVRRRRRP